jgi:hypothetical protein
MSRAWPNPEKIIGKNKSPCGDINELRGTTKKQAADQAICLTEALVSYRTFFSQQSYPGIAESRNHFQRRDLTNFLLLYTNYV